MPAAATDVGLERAADANDCCGRSGPTPILSVVVPCFNEAAGVRDLCERLATLEARLSDRGPVEFLLVDDGSSDDTRGEIERCRGLVRCLRLLRHAQNRGIAAATMTGIGEANAAWVGVLDADCTYDPLLLIEMLDAVAGASADVAAVTASPYHPRGRVDNIAPWRLRISRTASWLYGRVFRARLHTYTSCCRLYRRGDVARLKLVRPGFVGVTEILWRLDREAKTILEHPAKLSSRQTGTSKMKVVRAAWQHLGLMATAAKERLGDLWRWLTFRKAK